MLLVNSSDIWVSISIAVYFAGLSQRIFQWIKCSRRSDVHSTNLRACSPSDAKCCGSLHLEFWNKILTSKITEISDYRDIRMTNPHQIRPKCIKILLIPDNLMKSARWTPSDKDSVAISTFWKKCFFLCEILIFEQNRFPASNPDSAVSLTRWWYQVLEISLRILGIWWRRTTSGESWTRYNFKNETFFDTSLECFFLEKRAELPLIWQMTKSRRFVMDSSIVCFKTFENDR